MKKKLFGLIALAASFVAALGFASCGGGDDKGKECNHSYGLEGEVTKEATCTAEGEMTFTCTKCGEPKVESIEKKAHDFKDEKAEEKYFAGEANCSGGTAYYYSCTVCGEAGTDYFRVGEAAHTFDKCETLSHLLVSKATCQSPAIYYKRCSICSAQSETETFEAGGLYGHTVDTEGVCSGCNESVCAGLEFTAYGTSSYKVTGIGSFTGEDLVIPAEYNGKKVIDIESYVFAGCYWLKSVELPVTLTSMRNSFSGCTGLETVKYTGTMEQWLDINRLQSFEGDIPSPLQYGAKLYINGKLIEGELVIPDGEEGVGAFAFAGYQHITSVTVPASLKNLTTTAFMGCPIERLNVPDLKSWATVSLHTSYGYDDRKNFFDDPVDFYVDGSLVTDLTFPADVTEIYSSFNSLRSLKTVVVPETVTYFGGIGYCPNLTKLTVNTPETSMACIYNCPSLIEIVIPDSVQTLYNNPFTNCPNLVKITIGSGMQDFKVPDTVWEVCNKSSLTIDGIANVYTPTSGESKISVDGDYVLYTDGANVTLVGYLGDRSELIVPEGVTAVADSVYANLVALKKLVLPSTVKTLSKESVEDFKLTLEYIELNGVTDLEAEIFAVPGEGAYAKLREIVLGDGVETIGEYAFSCQEYVYQLTLGANVESIGANAFESIRLQEVYNKSSFDVVVNPPSDDIYFYGAYAIDYVYTPTSGESKITTDKDGYVIYANGDDKILIDYKGTATDIVIPDGVTTVKFNAFWDMHDKVTSLTVPASVVELPDFEWGWKALESFTVAEENTVYASKDGVLFKKGFTELIQYPVARTDWSYCIPRETTIIRNYAFQDAMYLVKLTTGRSYATSVTRALYDDCLHLAEIVTDDNYNDNNEPTSTITVDDNGFIIQTGTDIVLLGYVGTAKKAVVPENVTKIAAYAFVNSDVQEIVFGENVTTIGDYAFKGCKNLVALTLPAAITSLYNAKPVDSPFLSVVTYDGTKYEGTNLRQNDYYNSPVVVVKCTDGWDIIVK